MKNVKTIALAILALSAGSSYAAEKMTSEARIAQLGGFVSYPNSQKGSVAFVNTQKSVNLSGPLGEMLTFLSRVMPIKIDVIEKAPAEPLEILKASGANYAVIVVDDPKYPTSMIVPEEAYAVVNVGKYKANLKLPEDRAVYERRCARGALKAFVLLCSGGGSRYPAGVAFTHNVRELDGVHDKLAVDTQDSIKKYLGAVGITPLRRTIYRRACEEGWAPAPTNEFQKAIWDKVHALPANPIKIKPETKPVKE